MHASLAPLTKDVVAASMTETASRGVLMACVTQPRCAKDISVLTGIPLTTVYRQIHRLATLGVLMVERSAMTPDGRKYDLYRSRIEEVHLDLDEEGDHVTWRPNVAVERSTEWS